MVIENLTNNMTLFLQTQLTLMFWKLLACTRRSTFVESQTSPQCRSRPQQDTYKSMVYFDVEGIELCIVLTHCQEFLLLFQCKIITLLEPVLNINSLSNILSNKQLSMFRFSINQQCFIRCDIRNYLLLSKLRHLLVYFYYFQFQKFFSMQCLLLQIITQTFVAMLNQLRNNCSNHCNNNSNNQRIFHLQVHWFSEIFDFKGKVLYVGTYCFQTVNKAIYTIKLIFYS